MTTKPALPEPVGWIVGSDLSLPCAAAFAHPVSDTAREHYVSLYSAEQMRTVIDATLADCAQALSSAIGWPGGISDPVLDWPTLLRYVAEARTEIEALKSDIADALTTIAVYEAEARAVPVVTDNMVSRFLCWPLPRDFYPDCGISFDGRKDDEWNKNKTWPTGTNLLTAIQARQMLAHVLAEQTKPAVRTHGDGNAR